MTTNSTPGNQPGDLNQLQKDLQEAVTLTGVSQQAGSSKTSATNSDVSSLPEKFKGKSLEDIVGMYESLHSQYGRMANDLGTQRKLTDRLLDLKRNEDLQSNSAAALPTIKSDDLLDSPAAAIDKVVSARLDQERQRLDSRLGQLEANMAQERFVSKHPDYQQVADSADFSTWVRASQFRQRVAAQAAQGDYLAADEIISEYKASRRSASSGDASQSGDNLDAARKASLEGGSTPEGKATTGKVYRRADLIRLKVEKPRVYSDPQFQAEIMKAYAEGRVR
jgi:hypothetical protein